MALVTGEREIQQPVSVESVMVDDNEIIKNLQLLEEKDFYETVEVLKTIDYNFLTEAVSWFDSRQERVAGPGQVSAPGSPDERKNAGMREESRL